MPSKTDKSAIKDPFLDRRCKLLPCQKEMVSYWFERGLSITGIASMFNVSNRTIRFIIDPESKQEYMKRREERGGWKQYYNREDHAEATRQHRQYKKNILKK
jgi:IS30 family transposase